MSNLIRKFSESLGKFLWGLIQTDEIADGAVTAAKIASGVLVDEKVKASSGDSAAGYLWNKLDSDRLIDLDNQTTSVLIQLGLINSLGGASLGDSLVLLAERTSDNSLYKFSKNLLTSWTERRWLAPVSLDNPSAVAIPEDTDKEISLISLGGLSNSDFTKNKRCIWGYSDNKSRFLGRLIGIGKQGYLYEDADCIALRGSIMVVTAADYSTGSLNDQCWFSILSEQLTSVGFPVADYSGAAKQIDHVINAVFIFDYPLSGGVPVTDGRWILVDWECMPQKFWKDTDVLIRASGDDYEILIPNTNKFPMNGYYQFFAHIDMSAIWDWDGMAQPVERYSTIQVQLIDSDGMRIITKTPYHDNQLGDKAACPDICCCRIYGTHQHTWIDVMGFAHLDNADCSGRFFTLKIIKPLTYPPDSWGVTACDWEVHYLERKKAAWCNPAA